MEGDQLDLFATDATKATADTTPHIHRHPLPTEVAAAIAQRARTGTQRARVLQELANAGHKGCTDYELSVALCCLRTAAGTRRKELQEEGLVEPADTTRPTDTGQQAMVWRLTPRGEHTARVFNTVTWAQEHTAG